MVTIKMRLNKYFSCLTSFFAILALPHYLRCMERHMEADGLFHLGWFWRTGQSGCRARFFNFGNVAVASMEHGREPQRTRATADTSHSRREPQQTWATTLAKRGWRRIPMVTAAAFEQSFHCYYCDGGRAGWVWRWGGASIIGNGMHVLTVLPCWIGN
jgi:hypothetical protein